MTTTQNTKAGNSNPTTRALAEASELGPICAGVEYGSGTALVTLDIVGPRDFTVSVDFSDCGADCTDVHRFETFDAAARFFVSDWVGPDKARKAARATVKAAAFMN